jgi:APA family basic amino acid/polyamine antiporter
MLNESKKLGLRDSSAILIGGMIGSAIFSLSGVTIAGAGPAAILSWIIAAVILFFYGMQTAELSTIYPKSGGVFVFPEKALGKTEKQGKFWGWIAAWSYLFGCIGGAAFSVYYIGYYLGQGFPALAGVTTLISVVAAVICGLLILLNISATGKVNTVLTFVLAATMIIFIVIAFGSGKWDASNFNPFIGQGASGNLGFISAIPVAMLAYGAIVAVAFMVDEIKNPRKTIPRAMTIGMAVTVVLYVMSIVATLGLITAGFLAEHPEFTYIPMFAAAFTQLASIPWLVNLIVISAVLALLTTILVVMLLAARTFQAAAAGGLLPKGLAKVGKNGTPINATILTMIIVVAFAALPDVTNIVVNLGALSNVLVVAIISITVVAARKKNPNVEGKFKAPGGSAVSVIVLIALIICYIPDIMNGSWMLWVWTACYYAVALIIFAATIGRSKAPELLKDKV